jgi:hypothetical protein
MSAIEPMAASASSVPPFSNARRARWASADGAAGGGEIAGDEPQQRGFAGAVDPDDAGAPGGDGAAEVVEDDPPVGPGEREIGEREGGRHEPLRMVEKPTTRRDTR